MRGLSSPTSSRSTRPSKNPSWASKPFSRGRNLLTSELVPPIKLFQMAQEEHLNVDMEELCRNTALHTFAGLKDWTPSETGAA